MLDLSPCFTALLVHIIILSRSCGALASCQQSAARPQPREGTCHFQKNRDTLGAFIFAEAAGAAVPDACGEQCGKKWSLIQLNDAFKPSCEDFCKDNGCPCLKPWAERCLLNSCASCPQCGGNATTKAPTTHWPTQTPTGPPTPLATEAPTETTTAMTPDPTLAPTGLPTEMPTVTPTETTMTATPTPIPATSDMPTETPTGTTTAMTQDPTLAPTDLPTEMPTETPTETTTTTTIPRPTITPCRNESVRLDFELAQVAANNLGGQGPWEKNKEKILYKNIASYDHNSIHLEVTALTDYFTNASGRNGLNGAFGNINFETGQTTDLRFKFINSATWKPVELKQFEFTFFDIDNGPDGRALESITVRGADSYLSVPDSEVSISQPDANSVMINSTKTGYFCDNPAWPESLGIITCDGLTVDQEKRAVMFLFSQKSQFEATVSIKAPGKARNILFAGASTLVRLCPGAR